MNKTLKFKSHFVESILDTHQITTTRLFDDKDLSVGDTITLIDSESGKKFGDGMIVKIKQTSFQEMVKDASDVKGMYEQYKAYYGKEIKPDDIVKWIDIKLS